MNLGSWLRKTPQPHTIDVDGKKVAVPNGGGKWRDLVRTIETMKGSQITALDSAGNVIRAFTIDDEDDKPAVQPKTDVQVFANLIAEAYEKGTKSYAPLLDNAMLFIERQGQRLAKAEAEIDRLRIANAKLRAEVAEASAAPADSEDSVIGALAAGMLQAQQESAGVTPIKAGAKK